MAFDFKPNNLFMQMAAFYSNNKGAVNPATGRKALVKIANQGSSRSGKTYATIQLIYTFCNKNVNKGLYIAVLRETLVDCRKFTYKDFIECFTKMGVMDRCTITEYPNPRIKIYGNTIEFMGLAEQKSTGGNNEAPRTDICFVNEIISVNTRQAVQGWIMRCEKLFISDWNPSYTSHWIFDMEKEYNVLFTRTCYLDNAHLTDNVVSSIEEKCPWDFADSKIIIDEFGFKKRIWKKPERPDNCSPADYHLYRRENIPNKEAKTIDKWYWLVYGEGTPAPKEGAIFDPIWIKEFPETGLDHVNLSLDFGYTADPSVLVLSGVNVGNKELYAAKKTYSCTPDSDTLFELIYPHLLAEERRRRVEANGEAWCRSVETKEDQILALHAQMRSYLTAEGNNTPKYDMCAEQVEKLKDTIFAMTSAGVEYAPIVVACDSADKYKDIEFVRDLNAIAMQRCKFWQFAKVKKPSITVRISIMKRFKIFVVACEETEREAQNYVYQVIEGNKTNIPIDKFNHFWDSLGYGVIYFYRWVINL